ncbi:hypothetical protein [Streptomyces virginiae]
MAFLMLITGCGGRQTTTTTGEVTTTVVQDSQRVTAAISAGAVLISSAAAAWITHYFTGRTERRRQEHADIQEAAKREHEAKLSHEQRIREQVIATSTTISKMLQDFRSKIGETTEAADTLAATLLYDESGERHDRRGLKAREASTDRPVPIPPVLVASFSRTERSLGPQKEGRVFGNERGGVVGSSVYWRVWEEAREYALPPERIDSPLAGRPYNLRHACIARWLNAGVPNAAVAGRVGNSPEVIHRRYHGCIDGHEEAANAKIVKALEEEGDTS